MEGCRTFLKLNLTFFPPPVSVSGRTPAHRLEWENLAGLLVITTPAAL